MQGDTTVGRDGSAESELARAIAEFIELQRAGRAPPIVDFAQRHPTIEAELKSCLGLLGAVGDRDDPGAAIPKVLGDFKLLRLIGRGGMGLVYEAEQLSLPRRVALKVLPVGVGHDVERLARFRREIETTARLQHPNIVPVHETGEWSGFHYYAMPLLQGESLDALLRNLKTGPPSALLRNREELVRWVQRFISVALALHNAHAVGIIHRDIKPSNLFLDTSGCLLILDFGLTRSSTEGTVTITGEMIGTPRYMSPEQILAGKCELDGRSDIFSLAATLYEMLTLSPPFPGGDREALFRSILATDPAPPRRIDPRVPRDLEVVVLKALEKQPERRYATMGEFAADLQRFLDYAPVHARPVGPLGRLRRRAHRNPVAAAAIVLAMVALLSTAAISIFQSRRDAAARADEKLRMTQAELSQARSARERLVQLRGRPAKLDAAILAEESEFVPGTPFWSNQNRVNLRREAEACRREYEELFRQTLSHLFSALRLSPDDGAVRHGMSSFVFEEYCEAEKSRDRDRMMSLRPLLDAYRGDDIGSKATGAGSLAITTEPPGADVFLFRCVEREFCLVPVPVSPSGGASSDYLSSVNARGPWSYLSVTLVEPSDAALRVGDDVLMVCGTPPHSAETVIRHLRDDRPHPPSGAVDHVVALRRGGQFESLTFPPCPTLAVHGERIVDGPFPLRCTETNRIGQTPLSPLELEMGSYLALLRKDGYPDVRLPFEIAREERAVFRVPLFTQEIIGDGFVYVPAGPAILGGDSLAVLTSPLRQTEIPYFFIQRYETTFQDYLAYIRELDATDHSLAEKHAPRTDRSGPLWVRDEAGVIQPKQDQVHFASWPVIGVSYPDAKAYCRWLTSKLANPDVTFDLPTEDEWEKAGRGADGRFFTWGNDFEWTFARLGMSAQIVSPVIGGLYPTDESVYGICDLSGNVREWCLGAERSALRVVRGGCWGYFVSALCRLADRSQRRAPDVVDSAIGFRVVKHVRTQG